MAPRWPLVVGGALAVLAAVLCVGVPTAVAVAFWPPDPPVLPTDLEDTAQAKPSGPEFSEDCAWHGYRWDKPTGKFVWFEIDCAARSDFLTQLGDRRHPVRSQAEAGEFCTDAGLQETLVSEGFQQVPLGRDLCVAEYQFEDGIGAHTSYRVYDCDDARIEVVALLCQG